MKDTETILAELKLKGFRRSAAREAILRVLKSAYSPLSAPEIEQRTGRRFNKTTVYRELERLKRFGYLSELTLRNDLALYELVKPHHHHLICTNCGEVRDVNVREAFDREERCIERREGFRVFGHSLEFFGLCSKCQ